MQYPMKIIKACIVSLLALGISACKTWEEPKYTEFTRTTDFTYFKTFSLVEVRVSENVRLNRIEEIRSQTQQAIRDSLQALGYEETGPDFADFSVRADWRLVSTLKTYQQESTVPPPMGDGFREARVPARSYSLTIQVEDKDGVFWLHESDERITPQAFTVSRAASASKGAMDRFPKSTLF